jgi:hypothetical protein
MVKRTSGIVLAIAVALALVVSCGRGAPPFASPNPITTNSAGATVPTDPSGTTVATTSVITSSTTSVTTAAAALAAHGVGESAAVDAQWTSGDAVAIMLADGATTVSGEGATVTENTVTITAAGAYLLSGTLTDGQVVVDTEDKEIVQLILNGVDIRNSSSAPIFVAAAEATVLILADGSENFIADGATYVFPNPEDDEPNAAIFSKDDLAIAGNGALTVEANYNDGIGSKDSLVISGGDITVNAVDDGVRGKDYLMIEGGTFDITAGGDGFKADEDEDATLGYVAIAAGTINITAGGDAISAETDLMITGGDFTLSTAGGSTALINEELSAKGIKSGVSLTIDGGTFAIDSADDAIHTNGALAIGGGVFALATGDDGIHADAALTINGGEIVIRQSYEGIESAVITINDGNIHLTSSDDGVNVAGGVDGSGDGGPGGGFGGRGGRGGERPADYVYTGSNWLYINGGYLVVNAAGDGLDANGAIAMTDGVVIVNGPTERMNGALDYDGTFNISGGFLVTVGSAGMAQAPGLASTQNSLLLNLDSTAAAGTLVNIADNNGDSLLTFAPAKAYQSITFSAPTLASNGSYTVSLGGNASGDATDGLYSGGDYSGGETYTTFTVSSVTTRLGNNMR